MRIAGKYVYRDVCFSIAGILALLLKYGARVSQKNKLGLTALHMAASNGNSLANTILVLEDPDGINYKTEMKETPLFFAVKNDHMDCAELLLRWGANSEVLNLRYLFRLAHPLNRNFPVQQKLQGDDVLLSACETLLSMTDQDAASESDSGSNNAYVATNFQEVVSELFTTPFKASKGRSICSLISEKLDHVSLDYSKLSDFMKCFSDLCSAKVVPIGRGGPLNHMVLSSKHPTLQQQLRHRLTIPIAPIRSSGNVGLTNCNTVKETPSTGISLPTRFLQFSEQDSLFHMRPWLQKEHSAELQGSNCHGRKMFRLALWANIPCKHLLWCTDCKLQASLATGSFAHKCVVCDVEVQKMDLLPCQDGRQLVGEHISP
ncbi:uncharacterized protein LOC112091173 [Morus notabilis]|uniref:uncharacterized protein LOC112091173 n=1 Tax=Morus notabilis TaxID=981085 RepID=UPI000CED7AE1|nr:uncharacterized protein LOC112091173 [Morus notabilis]